MTRQKYKIPSANTAVTKARGIHSVLRGGGFELLGEVPDVHTKAMIAVTNAITDQASQTAGSASTTQTFQRIYASEFCASCAQGDALDMLRKDENLRIYVQPYIRLQRAQTKEKSDAVRVTVCVAASYLEHSQDCRKH